MQGELPVEADLVFNTPPVAPFDWVREGTSFWLFDKTGEFGIPRLGLEAEPWAWDKRRFQANFALGNGRVLRSTGVGDVPALCADAVGKEIAGGPMSFRCIEPFKRWLVKFDGQVIDTHTSSLIDQTVDETYLVPLRYEFEITMHGPPNEQNISPEFFFSLAKGEQRDAVSIGLGWRFDQMLTGEGYVEYDGRKRDASVVGNRVKRRSIRTDGLFLRGHCWQAVLFPDGRAVGYEARPVHDDGQAPWNRGFIYQNGKMYPAKATKIPWLNQIIERGDDVSFELESELGVTRITGETCFTVFQLSKNRLWGIALSQSGAKYTWGGVTSYGMVERSSTSVVQA